MHLSMLSPRVGGGGGGGGAGYPREFDSATFPLGRDFDTWVLPLGREFDMAAILEGRENLEMSRRAKDLYCFFALFWTSFWSFFAMSERKVSKFVLFALTSWPSLLLNLFSCFNKYKRPRSFNFFLVLLSLRVYIFMSIFHLYKYACWMLINFFFVLL